jgi:hypothetical protein
VPTKIWELDQCCQPHISQYRQDWKLLRHSEKNSVECQIRPQNLKAETKICYWNASANGCIDVSVGALVTDGPY